MLGMAYPMEMLAAIMLLMALLTLPQSNLAAQEEYYTAAVFEYAPPPTPKNSPEVTLSIILTNLAVFEKATSVAARQGADIIVFPESILIPQASRELYKKYGEYIPDSNNQTWNPCELPTSPLIAKTLSCMAKRHNIYLVANTLSKQPCSCDDPDCPDDRIYIYNTNVVFNRKGELIARYNKYFLYFETGVDIPKHFEYVVFETEFATVGTFICFDIIWKPSVELLKKHNVATVVLPQYWIEAPPIYSWVQTTSSWATENDVNLLAANVQLPSVAAVGSGIFLGPYRIAHYVYEPNRKSKLLVANIPVRVSSEVIPSHEATVIEFQHPWTTFDAINNSGECSEKILGPPKNELDFRCMDLDLSNFTLVRLQKGRNTANACNNGLCCLVEYDAVDMDEDYYLAVSNATLYISNYYGIWLETCMVIRCDEYNGTKCSTFPTQSNSIFKSLFMKANITSEHVYPSVLTSGMQLLSPDMWSYANGTLYLETCEYLLFVVMNGRPYDRDPPYPLK